MLLDLANECHQELGRILAYVAGLTFIVATASFVFETHTSPASPAQVPQDWSRASHSRPAFSLKPGDGDHRAIDYSVLRHRNGGRKDVVRWTDDISHGSGVLELTRLGGDYAAEAPFTGSISPEVNPDHLQELRREGVISTKFGAVDLIGFSAAKPGDPSCLAFSKNFQAARLTMSGWACHTSTMPALRTALACTIDQLDLLTSGNAADLAALFAQAELTQHDCKSDRPTTDWVTVTRDPVLRGTL